MICRAGLLKRRRPGRRAGSACHPDRRRKIPADDMPVASRGNRDARPGSASCRAPVDAPRVIRANGPAARDRIPRRRPHPALARPTIRKRHQNTLSDRLHARRRAVPERHRTAAAAKVVHALRAWQHDARIDGSRIDVRQRHEYRDDCYNRHACMIGGDA